MSMNNDTTEFRVTVLSERSVKTLFSKCLPKETTKSFEEARLFKRVFGYPEDQDPIYFDKEKLLENKKTIHFLFGQLKSFHNVDDLVLQFEDIVFNYLGELWTTDKEVIFKFLHLGVAAEAITPLCYPTHHALKNPSLLPTRIPEDPEFDSWIEGYKKFLEGK